jgi:hypothetical protein
VQGDQYRRRLLRDSLVMGITIGAAAFPSSEQHLKSHLMLAREEQRNLRSQPPKT